MMNRIPLLWSLVTLLVCLVISGLLALDTKLNNQKIAEKKISQAAKDFSQKAYKRIELYQYGLRGARGFVLAEGNALSREQFLGYSLTRDIDKEFPGARGIGFIRRVLAEQEAEFLVQARADGKADFAIRQLSPHTNERYVIQYIEPVDRNLQAVGLDIASEEHRKAAADAAISSGEVQLTAPITLVQARGKPMQSFLMLLPIYKTWATPAIESERQQQAIGWTYAPLLMEEILSSINLDKNMYHLRLSDIGSPEKIITFYNSDETISPSNLLYTQTVNLNLFGRIWKIEFSAQPAFVTSLHQTNPLYILTIGVILSLLLGTLAIALGSMYQTKQESYAHQAHLVAIIENTTDAIIGKTLDGTVTSWNRGAEILFGYQASEAIGRTLLDLIIPPQYAHEEVEILRRLKLGENVQNFVTQRSRKNGNAVDVSVNVSPIRDVKGNIIGASKTVRDITELKLVERRIININVELEQKVKSRTEALEQAQRNLQTILDNVPSVIGYWDTSCFNKVANQAHLLRFGVSLHQLPDISLHTLVGAKLYKRLRPLIDQVVDGIPQTLEHSIVQGTRTNHYLLQLIPDRSDNEIQGFYLIEHDITEVTEKRLELANALRENRALLNTINQQFLFSVTDVAGVILDVNDQFCVSSGFSREELIGNTHKLVNSGYHPREFWQQMWQMVLGGRTWRNEICNRTKTGELLWFDSVIAPFADESGKITRLIALRSDITQRKLAEQQQEQLHQLLETVLTAASEFSIIATDLEGTITLFNRGAENMLGYMSVEMIGVSTPAVIHLESEVIARGKELSEQFNQEINGFQVFVYKATLGEPETRRWTYVRKNGTQLPVMLTVTAMRNSQRKLVGYLGIAQDISEQLSAQHELAAVRDQLSIATEIAQLGVWTWNLEDNSLKWNDRMFDMYEQPLLLNKQGLSYNHWSERVNPEDLPMTEAKLQAALAGTGFYDPVFKIKTPLSGEKIISARGQVERNEDGTPIRMTGINLDVTEQFTLEKQLREAKQLADDASAAKSNFLANMSHEIRTPMNAVMGMLQLVEQTPLTSNQKDYVTKAHTAAKSLLGIINDILDFSKIEAGKLQIDPHSFSIEDLLRDLSVIMSGTQGHKPVELIFDIPADLPSGLMADQLRLHQILVNLTSNALKFTAEGHVLVRITSLAQNSKRLELRFSIEDTGIGISPEQQTKIFSGFTQAEASTTRRFGGTGLGLVICKRLLNMMNSDLHLESELGRGSRFWFDLTLPITDSTPIYNTDFFGTTPLKVLVVDDNNLVASVLIQGLRSFNWLANYATNGEEALSKIKAAEHQGHPYDAVLMDWRMPDLDGIATSNKIHQDPDITKPPLLIMVTAYEQDALSHMSENDKSLFASVLTKPLTPQQLVNSIWKALHGESYVAEENPVPISEVLKGIRLLVVEDNELNRQVAKELLSNAGANVDLAEGGVGGVATILANPQKYDLVIMDIQMPDIDGYEATKRIRADRRFKSLPILAMTANASATDRQACLDAGMNDHIGKPIDINKVIPLILQLTGKTVTFVEDKADVESTESTLLEPIANTLKRFANNQELLAKMQINFREEMQKYIEKIVIAESQQNIKELTSLFHSIKGMAATVGALALSHMAADFERNSKTPEAEPITSDDISKLSQLFNSTCDAFAQFNSNPITTAPHAALSANEIHQHLEQLAQLLRNDNMEALDVLELLRQALPPSAILEKLIVDIEQLDFKNATKTLSLLMQQQ